MKRMPCSAFLSVTMPEAGERNVRVRFVSPERASALTWASEMSQFFSRARLDSAGGANEPVQHAQAGDFGPDTQFLDLLGADADSGSTPRAAGVLLAFIDCDVVHSHRVLLRHRRGVTEPHRMVRFIGRLRGAVRFPPA